MSALARTALAPLGADFRAEIRNGLRRKAEAHGLDGVLLLLPANLTYATGFHFSVNERPIGLYVPVDGEPTLFVPLLELENAQSVPGVVISTYEEYPGTVPPILFMVASSGANRIAIDMLDARMVQPLSALVAELVLEDLCAELRYIKTEAELALTREAAHFADLCLERLLHNGGAIISGGGSELDLLADCVGHARSALLEAHGAAFAGTKLGITASVHSGPRAALPHGATSHRKPLRGETLIAGIGCSLGGYHAESGVTLVVAEMDAEQRRVMQAMEACNDAAVSALRPGALCQAVNEAAMEPLLKAGLGQAIRHRIGHGMGAEGHEAPWLAPGDRTPVAANMVFSNEPGVYRPDRDGYRTINTMIVHADGVEIPSRFQADHPIDTRILAL
ncbi:Xaa-Pro aminopeptidase [Devosia enhydra]|uniref:Xaa-Pro aminopeptidase n=1 Tax=Devosia enhydra TaxID=665118 RepID=A0A1K2HV95_9HYPH|nr:Xaa-Pro peptidase family protein [Devosia enhydra]SFZ82564.1 Xaa-Pro aminopeptidase [Devosia enhydra]